MKTKLYFLYHPTSPRTRCDLTLSSFDLSKRMVCEHVRIIKASGSELHDVKNT